MASSKNNQHKGSGADNSDINKSTASDASDVDWMIMSDLSTRIGVVSQPQKTTIQPPVAKSLEQDLGDLDFDNDVEDLEWLQSIGLDSEIERSPNITAVPTETKNDVENIDWMIVTNFQQRIDDSGVRAKTKAKPEQTSPPNVLQSNLDSLSDSLNDDFDLEALSFLEDSDLSDLDSLGFDTSDSFNNLNSSSIDSISNDNEQDFLELNSFLEDNNDLNAELDNELSDLGQDISDEWDSIDGFESLDGESIDQVAEFTVDANGQLEEFEEFNQFEEAKESIDIDVSDVNAQFEQFDEEIVGQPEIYLDEQSIDQVEQLLDDSSIQNDVESGIEDFNDGFGEIQDFKPLDAANISDEIWSNSVSNDMALDSYDDVFANSWEMGDQNIADNSQNIDISDDSIWGGDTSEPVSISDTLISNAFEESAVPASSDNLELLEKELNYENIAESSASDANWDLEEDFVQNDLDNQIVDAQDPDWNLGADQVPTTESLDAEELDNWQESIEAEITADYYADEINDSNNDSEWDQQSLAVEEDDDSSKNILSNSQVDDFESILDENFDLETFDDDSLIEYPLPEPNISTTLTPVRRSTASKDADVELEINPPSHDQQAPFLSGSEDFSLEDEFEKAIANDSLEDELLAELGIEEDFANETLNGKPPSADFAPDLAIEVPPPSFDNIAANSFPKPPVIPSYDANNHDFLDDFDLDSVGSAFDGDEFDSDFDSSFDSGFTNPAISTGLTAPAQPVSSPDVAPPTPNPPPLPFMLPLPPKRSSAQPKQDSPSRPPVHPHQSTGGSINIDDRSFDSFHNDDHDSSKFKNKNNQPIGSVDENWSDLLDADTVVSDVLPPPINSYKTNPSPMHTGNPSQGRSSARRKQTRLPDFDELGLEIHDDANDWSGLLDSGDLSDNITTISPSVTPLSPRGQKPFAKHSDTTSTSETREIPRDRRPPQVPSFSNAPQSQMAAPPDQIDFNRFTEDSYNDSYESHIKSSELETPSKPKISMPSISLESLWQDYLKFPAMAIGAIGGVALLYTVLNRPVFELGLRWGIFKDARGLDFTNADFRGAKLDNVDFSKAILTKAKMQDASLEGANFQDANLDGVSFVKANLNQAKLVGASVVWSEFRDAQMRFVDFSGADLTRSNFTGAVLNGASFKGTKIGEQGTDKATKLPPINLLAWQIVNQPLEGRNLSNRNLSGLNLSFSNLKRANLTRTRLNFTDLAEADLRGANLTGGQIDGANLNGAKMNGINLTGVKFDKSKLPKTDEQTICPNGKNGPCKF